MTAGRSLKQLYADEMWDLYSANDQMIQIVKTMGQRVHDTLLKQALDKSLIGIGRHAKTLASLLGDVEAEQHREPCRGMEGLVTEAMKHLGQEALPSGELLDLVIIAQYQRMSHYGLAGFGTAAAYAAALGMTHHATRLSHIVADIHRGDQYASTLAARVESAAVKAI